MKMLIFLLTPTRTPRLLRLKAVANVWWEAAVRYLNRLRKAVLV